MPVRLVLFISKKCDSIYNRIRYLISIKSGIKFIIYHNYVKIEVHSYDSLFLQGLFIMLYYLVWNKDKIKYYYNIEKNFK